VLVVVEVLLFAEDESVEEVDDFSAAVVVQVPVSVVVVLEYVSVVARRELLVE
jgi:hypothetical protein